MNDQHVFGSGDFRYRVALDWPCWPDNWNVIEVVGVATDSQDRAFVLSRGEHPARYQRPGKRTQQPHVLARNNPEHG